MCYGTKNTPECFIWKVYQLKRSSKRHLELFLPRLKRLYSLSMTLSVQFVILKIVSWGKNDIVLWAQWWLPKFVGLLFFFLFHLRHFALKTFLWSVENVRVEVKSKCILSYCAEGQTENFSLFDCSNMCEVSSYNRLFLFLFGWVASSSAVFCSRGKVHQCRFLY